MQKQEHKQTGNKSLAVAGHSESNGSNAAVQLKDNRPQSVARKKQAEALSGKSSAEAPVQKKANATGLPDNLKSGIENLSGHSLDDVKVHYNSSQPAQLNAYAYAQGTEIHVASGQEKHLPHEAWHVVQQKQGRVKPTMQMKNKVNINDDEGLEKEADVMGAKASGMQLKAMPHKNPAPLVQKKERSSSRVRIRTDAQSQPSGGMPVQLLLVRVRSGKESEMAPLMVTQLKIEGRAPTVVSGAQGDHTVAEGHMIFLLERIIPGKSHAVVAKDIEAILDHVEQEATAKTLIEGHFVTLSSSSLAGDILKYQELVGKNASPELINAALEDLIENFIRLWNKRMDSAFERSKGFTTGGGSGVDEKRAKKELHAVAKDVDEHGPSDESAFKIAAGTLGMIDYVPKHTVEGLKAAAGHLVTALEISFSGIPDIETDYETVANTLTHMYGQRVGLSPKEIELLDLYVITLLRGGKDDYHDELEQEILGELSGKQ